MNERYTMCIQRDAAIRIRTLGAILQVALDRTAHLCQLATNLMMTSCLQIHFQQIIIVGTSNDPIIEFCPFGTRHFLVVGIRLVLLLIAYEPMNKCSLWFCRTVLRDGPIGLMYLPLGKHLVETGEGFAGTGKKYQTADRTV